MDSRKPMPVRDRLLLLVAVVVLALVSVASFVYVSNTLGHLEASLPEEEENFGHAVSQLERDLLELDLQLGLLKANSGEGGDAVNVILQSLGTRIEALHREGEKENWPMAGAFNELGEIIRFHQKFWSSRPDTGVTPGAADDLRIALAPVRHQLFEQMVVTEGRSQGTLARQEGDIQDFRLFIQLFIAVTSLASIAGVIVLLGQRMKAVHFRLRGERYRQLFRGSRAVELLVNPDDGTIVDANAAASHYYGWDHATLCRMNIADINTLSRDEIAAEMALARKEQRHHFYFRHRLASGECRDVEVHSGPLHVEGREYLYSIVHDVTERRLAEVALQASEHRYREVLNGSIQGYWFVTPVSGVVLEVNDTMCRMLGLPREQILGRPFMSFAADREGCERLESKIAEALVTVHRVYDIDLRHADGTVRQTCFHATTLRSPTGDVLGSYAFVEDVTERRLAERALLESQRRLTVAVQAGRIGIWDYSPQEGTVWLSPEWKAQLGFADEELPNTLASWRARVISDDEARVFAEVDRFIAGEASVYDQSYRAVHRDGHIVCLRSFAQVVRDQKGRAVRLVGARVDLTEAVETQEKLAQVNTQQELVLNSTADGMYGTDAAGRVTFVNAACLRILGYSREDMLGKPSHALLHYRRLDGSPYSLEDCPVELVRRTGKPILLLEDVLWHAGDYPVPVELSVAPLPWNEGGTGALVSFRDISEREKYRQELERSNQELAQFAYVASHDLQEPLRAVSSYMTLVRRRYGPQLDDTARSFIDTAIDGAMRMTTMIRDLLDYSRVGTRGSELKPVDSATCLDQALDNLRIAISESGAVIDRPDGAMPWVQADASQLVSLLQNLVGNALKYRQADVVPHVQLRILPGERDFMVFEIQDNGIGIDPAYFERIFMPFQRLHTREKFEGNGIGLAICRKIVERHGGAISVDSAEGQGSTFRFTLHRAEPPRKALPAGEDVS